MFRSVVGISKVSSEWRWAKKMNAQRAREKLDKYVSLRDAIVHRGQYLSSVKKTDVDDYFAFISQLASKTGGAVNRHVKSIIGKLLWRLTRQINSDCQKPRRFALRLLTAGYLQCFSRRFVS